MGGDVCVCILRHGLDPPGLRSVCGWVLVSVATTPATDSVPPARAETPVRRSTGPSPSH